MDEETRRRVTYNIYLNAHTGISILYKHREADTFSLSKNEQLCRTFAQLVFHHYIQNKKSSLGTLRNWELLKYIYAQ